MAERMKDSLRKRWDIASDMRCDAFVLTWDPKEMIEKERGKRKKEGKKKNKGKRIEERKMIEAKSRRIV